MSRALALATLVAAVCVAVRLFPAGYVSGQPRHVNLKIVPGGLAVSAPSVNAVAGHPVTVQVTVVDARGTGAGWALNLWSPRPVRVARVAVQCAARSACTLPKASGLGAGPLILRAKPGSGMGVMRFVVTLEPLRTARTAPVKFLVSS